MKRSRSIAALLSVLIALAAHATNVYFPDARAVSPDGTYAVEGKSPDNAAGNWRTPFASNFTYILSDVQAKKVAWTRTQEKEEGSCQELFVDNNGWVVISTGYDELIFVGRHGRDTGKVSILQAAFTESERQTYVHLTSAGPRWAGYSLWYFVRDGRQRLFIIRPWWGRRIIADVEKGTLTPSNDSIAAACDAYERAYVLRELAKGVESRSRWEKQSGEEVWPVLYAAYLAGRLRIPEATELLQKFQDSTYSGSSAGATLTYKPPEGAVDPSRWEEMTMRRVVHLSLRRLGVAPGQYACTTFQVHFTNYKKDHTFAPTALNRMRSDGADAVKEGMRPEDVLSIIGAPDFNEADEWDYDMDTQTPYTLTITWGVTGVTEIKRKRPPLWKSESRDRQIVY